MRTQQARTLTQLRDYSATGTGALAHADNPEFSDARFGSVGLRDIVQDHWLILNCDDDLTSERSLHFVVHDATRSIELSGDFLLGGTLITTGAATTTLALPASGSRTYTFPTTTATLARTDAAQTFTGTQSFAIVNFSTSLTATSSTAGAALGQFARLDIGSDCSLKRFGARDFQFGVTSDANTYTLRCGVTSGTNIAAGDLILAPGTATGNAASGSLRLRTAPAGSSGATAQTLADTLVLEPGGMVNFARLSADAAMAIGSTHKIAVKVAGATYYLLATNV